MEEKQDFLIIGITPDKIFQGEDQRIRRLLENEALNYIHIRHPEEDIKNVSRLISAIPEYLHPKLTLHDHYQLAEEFNIGGIHLNFRNKDYSPRSRTIRLSRSCHSVAEMLNFKDLEYLDYQTLSPIFDSISKSGYKSSFPPETYPELSRRIKNISCPTIALGGITPGKFTLLRSLGFAGAAMLGNIFR